MLKSKLSIFEDEIPPDTHAQSRKFKIRIISSFHPLLPEEFKTFDPY
jgi:hypothetical protein